MISNHPAQTSGRYERFLQTFSLRFGDSLLFSVTPLLSEFLIRHKLPDFDAVRF